MGMAVAVRDDRERSDYDDRRNDEKIINRSPSPLEWTLCRDCDAAVCPLETASKKSEIFGHFSL